MTHVRDHVYIQRFAKSLMYSKMYAIRSLVVFRSADPTHDRMANRRKCPFRSVELTNPTGLRIALQ
jgi:hypothetical protein